MYTCDLLEYLMKAKSNKIAQSFIYDELVATTRHIFARRGYKYEKLGLFSAWQNEMLLGIPIRVQWIRRIGNEVKTEENMHKNGDKNRE